jgi:hypothetical protein
MNSCVSIEMMKKDQTRAVGLGSIFYTLSPTSISEAFGHENQFRFIAPIALIV